MPKKQSLQKWKMTKKPLYAGNEVMVDLNFPSIQAIEKQSTNEKSK